MELGYEDVEITTQQHPPIDSVQTRNTHPKRRRSEVLLSPTNIDVTHLGENRFSLLAGLEIENAEDCPKQRREDKAPRATIKNAKKTFCPPIFLFDVNIKRLVDQLEAKTPKITFKIKNVNKKKSKLYLSDATVHSEMMALLREKNIHSYSYTPKELKQSSFILRGLYHGTDVDEVRSAMEKTVPNVVSKVTRFTTPYSVKNSYDTGLFLVTLNQGNSLSDISHIKYLLSQTILWEKPKKNDKEVQCHRCQRWGHIAKNCNSEFQCVKCDKKHPQGECQRTNSESSAPHCVNCGVSGHPANWRGCPAYRNYLASRRERIKKTSEEKLVAKNNVNKICQSFRSPGKSFASLFQVNATQAQTQKPSIIEEFLKLANVFLVPEELSLEQQITNFLKNFKNMSKIEAKAEFLRLLKNVNTKYGP